MFEARLGIQRFLNTLLAWFSTQKPTVSAFKGLHESQDSLGPPPLLSLCSPFLPGWLSLYLLSSPQDWRRRGPGQPLMLLTGAWKAEESVWLRVPGRLSVDLGCPNASRASRPAVALQTRSRAHSVSCFSVLSGLQNKRSSRTFPSFLSFPCLLPPAFVHGFSCWVQLGGEACAGMT